MRLDPREVELIEKLRRMPTGKAQVVKDGGAIRSIKIDPRVKKIVDKKHV